MNLNPRRYGALALLPLSALVLASCASTPTETAAASSTAATTTGTAAEHAHDHDHEGELAEVSTLVPRVILSHDDGLTTLDAVTGEVIAETEHPGFLRLNQSGDGRHVMVTDGNEFLAFDSGNQAVPHGDHNHYYEGEPLLSDVSYEAELAGHVVVNDGLTAFFADGTGEVTVVDSEEVGNPDAERTTVTASEPHHGVAIPHADGTLTHTVGTEEERSTIRSIDAVGNVLAETTECPGIHGEAVASTGVEVFGCEDGPVLFDGTEFTKLAAEGYQRNGNLAGHADSPIVLGDNKTDEDAEFERPTSVVLIDTTDSSLTEVELDSSYWFRSLGRGPEGEALVLTYDGNLVVIDEESGEITNRIPVIEEWEENTEWQQPGPILQVSGPEAYITDAANQELVLVDLRTGEVAARHALDFAPVEMAVSTGRA